GCSDDTVDGEEARMAMIGMQAVTLPRIVTEHDFGTEVTDPSGDVATQLECRFELPVDRAEERDLAGGAERLGSGALFVLPRSYERCDVGGRIPRALRSVGAHEMVDDTSRRGPPRQR